MADEPRIEEVAQLEKESEDRHAAVMAAGFPGGMNAQDQAEIDAVGDQLLHARESATGLDAKPVPTYGLAHQRVPESMKENAPADWRAIPVHQIEILPEYGPEHDTLVTLRKDLEGMKRSIQALGPILETRLRCAKRLEGADLSEDGGANLSQEHVMALTQDEEAQRKRDATFEALRKQVEKTEDEQTRTRLTPVIEEICKRGAKEFHTKDQYAEFWSFLKQQAQKIFMEQKKLLERIKVIKKAVHAELGTPANPEYVGGIEGFQSRGGGLKN